MNHWKFGVYQELASAMFAIMETITLRQSAMKVETASLYMQGNET